MFVLHLIHGLTHIYRIIGIVMTGFGPWGCVFLPGIPISPILPFCPGGPILPGSPGKPGSPFSPIVNQ